MSDPCPTCGTDLNVVERSRNAGCAAWGFGAFLAFTVGQFTCQFAGAGMGPGRLLGTFLIGVTLGLVLTLAALAPLLAAGGAVLFRGGYRCCPRCRFLEIDGAERQELKPRWRSTLAFYRHAALWILLTIPAVAILTAIRLAAGPFRLPIPEAITLMVLGFAWLALQFAIGRLKKALDERRPPWRAREELGLRCPHSTVNRCSLRRNPVRF